jgi:hypothetical protein
VSRNGKSIGKFTTLEQPLSQSGCVLSGPNKKGPLTSPAEYPNGYIKNVAVERIFGSFTTNLQENSIVTEYIIGAQDMNSV